MNTQSKQKDIISPISDGVLPTRTAPEQARKQGRAGYDKPTPQNSIMLFIDHQIGLMLESGIFNHFHPTKTTS